MSLTARTDAPRWERPALLGLIGVAAVIFLVDLGVDGWANPFYSAAVQAGSTNLESFFFGSSDAANSITVDKPPASLWLMAISVRLFGLSPFAILLPDALMGIATTVVVYAIVRRRFPAQVALLAGFTFAVTPVAALMFRYNNPDALLVLLLTLGTYFVLRGVESGRIRWVIWAGVMVGFAFLTKQLQAFLVLPVFAAVYLYAAPIALRKRFVHLFAALGAVIVSAGWWVAIVELTPASMRPYIGGSQTNDFLELTFGYNGFGRLTGHEVGSVTQGGVMHWGYTGIDRLFSGDIGAQITWLLFAALLMIVLSLWFMRRLPRTSPTRATVLLLGGTLIVTALAFSFMAGIFHAYYTVALAPSLAGCFAIGVGMLWHRRSVAWVRAVMAVTLVGSAAWAFELLLRSGSWEPWVRWVVLGAATAAAVALLVPRSGRGVRSVAASVGLASLLLAPVGFTAVTMVTAHRGAIVTAGPGGVMTSNSVTLPGTPASATAVTVMRPGAAPNSPLRPTAAAAGNLLDAAHISPSLAATLATGADKYRWMAAATGSNVAAGFQLATGYPVMPIGGFNGSDPSPTLQQFEDHVRAGEIHWYVVSPVNHSNGGSSSSAKISDWVTATFTPITMGGIRFYDLTKPLA